LKLPITFAAFVLMASPAFAAPCFSAFPSFDNSNINVSFTDMVASPGGGVTCDVVTDPVVINNDDSTPDGAIYAYSSEYRVDSATGDTIHLETTANGIAQIATVPGSDDDSAFIRNYTGVIKGEGLQSDIVLNVDSPADNTAELVSLDYNFLGYTTLNEQTTSLDQVSGAQAAVVTHLNATAGLIVGANKPLERGDEIGLIGAIGSHTVGVTGHYNFGDGLSFDGGAALFDQSVGGAVTSGVLLGGKASYLQPEDGSSFRLLGNVGLSAAPNASMSFSRDYTLFDAGDDFSDVAASGTASGHGTMIGAWAEGGVLIAPDADTEVIFSVSYARNWLSLDGVAEEQTDSNPFAASIDDATYTYDTIKAKAAWTTSITTDVDLTAHGAIGYMFAPGELVTEVALVGPMTVGGQDEAFVEYGARVGWAFAENARWDVFALGSTGAETGTHAQIGTAVSMKF
jgi:hypothetical protein